MKKLKEMYNNGKAKLCGLHAAAYLAMTGTANAGGFEPTGGAVETNMAVMGATGFFTAFNAGAGHCVACNAAAHGDSEKTAAKKGAVAAAIPGTLAIATGTATGFFVAALYDGSFSSGFTMCTTLASGLITTGVEIAVGYLGVSSGIEKGLKHRNRR